MPGAGIATDGARDAMTDAIAALPRLSMREGFDPLPGTTPPEGYRTLKLWAGEEFSFEDLLDFVNPLQHIPVVSSIYRELTGDKIGAAAQLTVGAILGGPIGFIGSVLAVGVETETGKSAEQYALGVLDGSAGAKDAQVARTDERRDPFASPTEDAAPASVARSGSARDAWMAQLVNDRRDPFAAPPGRRRSRGGGTRTRFRAGHVSGRARRRAPDSGDGTAGRLASGPEEGRRRPSKPGRRSALGARAVGRTRHDARGRGSRGPGGGAARRAKQERTVAAADDDAGARQVRGAGAPTHRDDQAARSVELGGRHRPRAKDCGAHTHMRGAEAHRLLVVRAHPHAQHGERVASRDLPQQSEV